MPSLMPNARSSISFSVTHAPAASNPWPEASFTRGPARSWMTGTFLPARAEAARIAKRSASCDGYVPCEKLRRATSIPLVIIWYSVSSDAEAGPMVATICVQDDIGELYRVLRLPAREREDVARGRLKNFPHRAFRIEGDMGSDDGVGVVHEEVVFVECSVVGDFFRRMREKFPFFA